MGPGEGVLEVGPGKDRPGADFRPAKQGGYQKAGRAFERNFFICAGRMAEFAPFAPGRAYRSHT